MVIILSVSHHYHHHPHLAQQQNAQDTPTNATKEHLATFRVIRGGGGAGKFSLTYTTLLPMNAGHILK